MPSLQLVINVYGGQVQDVFCSHPEIEVLLVEWDVDPSDAQHPSVVEVPIGHRRTALSHVAELTVQPLDALHGSDAAAAIEAAEQTPC